MIPGTTRLSAAFVVALTSLISVGESANASSLYGVGVVTFASLGQATQTLSGTHPVLDLYVPGPAPAHLSYGARLTLTYSQSPLLDKQNSAVSVYVNDVSVGADTLHAAPGHTSTLTVQIPRAQLHAQGVNHVQISFWLQDRVHRGCGSSEDPNLDVTVYGQSWIRYDTYGLLFKPRTASLDTLPAPLLSPVNTGERITVGLPAVATDGELSAAAGVLARLGEDRSSLSPRIVEAAPTELRRLSRGSSLILVGTPGDNPGIAHARSAGGYRVIHGAWQAPHGSKLQAGTGLVSEIANPYDRRDPALVVSGNDQVGIERAGTVLASATLRRLLHGPVATIPSVPVPPTDSPRTDGAVTLADLGYSKTVLQGLGEQDAHFTFDLTNQASGSATLHLLYGHSDTVVSGVSGVRIDVNGQPAASRSFHSGDASTTRWDVTLPSSVLHAGSNDLNVRFFLNAPGVSCTDSNANSVWATVDPGTTLELPSTVDAPTNDLHLLPFPMTVDGSPNGTLIAVPRKTVDQNNVLELAWLLGTQSRVDTPLPLVVKADGVSSDLLAHRTVVLDGLASNNPLIRQTLGAMPLQATLRQLATHYSSVHAGVQESGNLGVAEAFTSPWNSSREAIVFSATRPSLLSSIRAHAFNGDLHGTVSTVDMWGNVQSLDTTSQRGPTAIRSAHRPIRSLELAGIAALLALIGFAATQRRQQGGLS